MEKHRALIDSLRDRVQGRYAAGSVADKLDREREAVEAFEQSQMGMFGAAEEPAQDAEKPLAADERYTLGHALERQLAAMAPHVGENFRAGKPTRLWNASMSGRFINQQRAVKLIDHNKRVVLAQGTGSGKTSIALAGFTHLKEQGKAGRGLFLVQASCRVSFLARPCATLSLASTGGTSRPARTAKSALRTTKTRRPISRSLPIKHSAMT